MVGIILLFVGAVLLVNGVGGLGKIDAKSAAVMNLLTGGLALVIALILLFRAETNHDFFGVATVFLFAFTYLYAGISMVFSLDMRGFGWFCFFVAITTIPCSILAFQAHDLRFGVFWLIWGALWFMFYLAYVPAKNFGRILPFTTIAVGVLTCWIPGLLMLVDRW